MKNLLPFRLYSIQESKSLKDFLVPAEPTSPLYHSTTYKNREGIKRKGLIPSVGVYTKNYTKKKNLGFELPPMVFACQEEMGFHRTYGGDLWEIDLNKVDVKWYHDPIHYNETGPKFKWYMTLDPIPPSALRLISSDEKKDDTREILLAKQIPFKNLREEMNLIEKDNPPLYIKILTKGNDSDGITIKFDESDKSNPNSVEWTWTVTRGGKTLVDNKFTADTSTISNVQRDNDKVYSMIKKDLTPYL
jgi:hypothetical protein